MLEEDKIPEFGLPFSTQMTRMRKRQYSDDGVLENITDILNQPRYHLLLGFLLREYVVQN